MFNLNNFNLENVPKTEDGKVDFSKDFFGKPAHLTVSGQLNVETYAFAFKNVNSHVYSKLAFSALIGIILAILIIAFHGLATDVVLRLIGALLIYNAIENIFSAVVAKSSDSGDKIITGGKKTSKIEAEFHESGDSSENNKNE